MPIMSSCAMTTARNTAKHYVCNKETSPYSDHDMGHFWSRVSLIYVVVYGDGFNLEPNPYYQAQANELCVCSTI